jgi:hypothetical protein
MLDAPVAKSGKQRVSPRLLSPLCKKGNKRKADGTPIGSHHTRFVLVSFFYSLCSIFFWLFIGSLSQFCALTSGILSPSKIGSSQKASTMSKIRAYTSWLEIAAAAATGRTGLPSSSLCLFSCVRAFNCGHVFVHVYM